MIGKILNNDIGNSYSYVSPIMDDALYITIHSIRYVYDTSLGGILLADIIAYSNYMAESDITLCVIMNAVHMYPNNVSYWVFHISTRALSV